MELRCPLQETDGFQTCPNLRPVKGLTSSCPSPTSLSPPPITHPRVKPSTLGCDEHLVLQKQGQALPLPNRQGMEKLRDRKRSDLTLKI